MTYDEEWGQEIDLAEATAVWRRLVEGDTWGALFCDHPERSELELAVQFRSGVMRFCVNNRWWAADPDGEVIYIQEDDGYIGEQLEDIAANVKERLDLLDDFLRIASAKDSFGCTAAARDAANSGFLMWAFAELTAVVVATEHAKVRDRRYELIRARAEKHRDGELLDRTFAELRALISADMDRDGD